MFSTINQPCATILLLSVSLVLIAPMSCQFSTILIKPTNTVSTVGNKTKMECSTNIFYHPVVWKFAPANTGIFSLIYTGRKVKRNFTSRYRIDTDDNIRYDIVIDTVDSSHAGKYKCTVDFDSATAELIVLGSDPVCRTDVRASKGVIVEGDYIKISCSISYTGYWDPEMTLNRSARETDSGSGISSQSDLWTSRSESRVIQFTASDNGATITLKTSFNPPSRSTTDGYGESMATNIPRYEHVWNYKANVLYGVRNLTMEPNSGIYQVGDRLTCSAAGNPSPTFQWTETGTNKVIDGPILTLNETMPLMKNLTFKCTARNTVVGESKEIWDVTTFMVTATPSSFNPTTIALTVSGVTALIVLLALALAKAMRVKSRVDGNLVNLRSTQQTSCIDENYDKIDESNIHVDENYDKIDESNIHVDENYDKLDEFKIQDPREDLASDGYSSLQRESSAAVAEQADYDPLPQYLTLIDV